MNGLDTQSFVAGMLFTMIADVFFAVASFFLEKAFKMQADRKKRRKETEPKQ